MSFAHERWDHVTCGKIEIVFGPIKIGGHCRNKIATILASISLAELEASNFCDRVPFIRRLEWAGEQRIFTDGLWRELGVNARRPEIKQLLYAVGTCRADHILGDGQIVVEKIDRRAAVGQY